MIVLALLQYPGSAGEHSSQLKNKLVVTMKGRSGYTFFQIAVYAFTPMVTLERIVLWNYHPYHEAEGLVRERVGHWTILRAVATPHNGPKSLILAPQDIPDISGYQLGFGCQCVKAYNNENTVRNQKIL